jgi:hypothetical protein
LENRRAEQILPGEGEVVPVWGGGTSGRREEVGKGYRRVNMVQILCIHVCKWENETVETIPGMGGEGDEAKWWRG